MHNEYPEIKALNEKPTKLMVFLHGVGSMIMESFLEY